MTITRWLQRLFSRPAAAAPAPAAATVPAAPAPGASVPMAAPALPADFAPGMAAQPADAAPAIAGMASARAACASGAAPVSFEQLDHVNRAWNAWLFERPQRDGLELDPAEQDVLDALRAILASQQSGAALVKRMPGLVPQILQSLRNDNFSGNALARTISSDVVLVAAVIRLANNCFLGAAAPIASVEHAVILIGQEGLRQLVTTVAFRPIIDVHSGLYTRRLAPRLWQHAERCAMGARALAAEMGVEPFDAFLAGLLQNVGMIVALRFMDGAAAHAPLLGTDLFLAQLAADARALAAGIAREWHFPEPVAQALLEQGGLRKGASMSPLGRLLKLADYLGKVRMLVEEGVLEEGDAGLFGGLPAQAAGCYAALAASRERVE
ncbi:HDOD domain-containing protein [Massilia forsythiae]|uniref:HDOD domain-containing protein n=1 Tax=Massilia forsythiae TaxID=2728020 RepID=A0A7Z2VXT7_9BURK|nr:HDOD domain-containing protein [Massilia forsythiae]QJE01412.1 HDOD domain-containing protein [Massilia forsythiae]